METYLWLYRIYVLGSLLLLIGIAVIWPAFYALNSFVTIHVFPILSLKLVTIPVSAPALVTDAWLNFKFNTSIFVYRS